MNRKAFLAVAVPMVVLCAVALSGCGGDQAKAKGYVKNGDEQIAAIEKTGEALGTEMNKAFDSVDKAISAGKTPDAAAFADSSARSAAPT